MTFEEIDRLMNLEKEVMMKNERILQLEKQLKLIEDSSCGNEKLNSLLRKLLKEILWHLKKLEKRVKKITMLCF